MLIRAIRNKIRQVRADSERDDLNYQTPEAKKPGKYMGGGSAMTLRRAKAQEGSQADGELSVKFVDAAGAVQGDAFDVYAFPDQSATDMTDYLPDIDTNDIIYIKQINGVWYVDWTPLKIGSSTDTVSSTAETVGGRLINNWYGKW